jgi:hypothetical protein
MTCRRKGEEAVSFTSRAPILPGGLMLGVVRSSTTPSTSIVLGPSFLLFTQVSSLFVSTSRMAHGIYRWLHAPEVTEKSVGAPT